MIAHLNSRKYDVERYKHHYIDEENEIATFYLFDRDHRWTGFQKYNPNSTLKKINNSEQDGRYFNHNLKGELCVWGLENLTYNGSLFVTESIFKSAAIHMAGFDSVTQLTSGCSKQFLDLVYGIDSHAIFIGDNDPAGIKFSKYMPGGFVLEKDLDEYPTEELRKILKSKNLWR